MKDYSCCQGYCGNDCCIPKCQGSSFGLCLEGCLCPVLSLSITRIAVMNRLSISPDPVDFQIIRTSNCLQLMAAACQCVACIISLTVGGEAGDIARCTAWSCQGVADCFTASVGGCMCVQINEELSIFERGGDNGGSVPVAKAETMER